MQKVINCKNCKHFLDTFDPYIGTCKLKKDIYVDENNFCDDWEKCL